MNLVDEIEKLQKLHDNGTLTDEEFASAKSRLLAMPVEAVAQPDNGTIEQELARLRLQSDLDRLDREWDRERETHMIHGKYGKSSLPSSEGSCAAAGVFGFIGVIFFCGVGLGGRDRVVRNPALDSPNLWINQVGTTGPSVVTISPTVVQHEYTGSIGVGLVGLVFFVVIAVMVYLQGQSRVEEYQAALANYHHRRRMLQESTGSAGQEKRASPADYLS